MTKLDDKKKEGPVLSFHDHLLDSLAVSLLLLHLGHHLLDSFCPFSCPQLAPSFLVTYFLLAKYIPFKSIMR